MNDEWVSATEAAQMMASAGIAATDHDKWISWACFTRRLAASGFGFAHLENELSRNSNRDLVNRRVWLLLRRMDPQYPLERPERRDAIEMHIDWQIGSFGYVINAAPGEYVQETWEQVHFDRVALQSLLRDRASASAVPRRGRSPTYPWPDFEAEAKRLIWDEGRFHEGFSQADCERSMAIWCEQNWAKAPAESLIRSHVRNAADAVLAEKASI